MGYGAPHRRRILVILTALAAAFPALVAVAPSAGSATAHAAANRAAANRAAARRGSTIMLCNKGDHIAVQSRAGRSFIVRNDWFRSPGCLTNWALRTNFRVRTSYRAEPRGRVVSFPDIFRGCAWGLCTANSKMPRQISRLQSPQATWRIRSRAGGRWNAAFDIWISKHKMTNGQAEGAELMIWIKVHDMPSAHGWPIVWVGHHRYHLLHWTAVNGNASWNYIQFRRLHSTRGVRRLSIRRFIRKAEHRGLIKPWWWLDNIEAGFEIWWGGKGLGTARFWAKQ